MTKLRENFLMHVYSDAIGSFVGNWQRVQEIKVCHFLHWLLKYPLTNVSVAPAAVHIGGFVNNMLAF